MKKNKKIKAKDQMEIHHHSNHHRPKFLYEFLMLFLAVTASFFVENIREYYIERHREKQFIESFVRDLKMDTIQINDIISKNKTQINGIDTLLTIIEKENSSTMINDIYYYSLMYLSSFQGMQANQRTITQLKNSGSMRLIKNFSVSDSIMQYDQTILNVDSYNEFLIDFFHELFSFQNQVLDFKVYRLNKINELLALKEISLLDDDKKAINLLYNKSLSFAGTLNSYIVLLESMKTEAGSLIEFLKETYNLEE